MTEHQKPTQDNGPTPKETFDHDMDVALGIARDGNSTNPARIAEGMMRESDAREARRDADLLRQGYRKGEAAGFHRGETAGRKRAKRMTAAGVALGLATGVVGTEAVNLYQETHAHHVVFEDITPGIASGETATQAIAASVQSYIDAQGIDPGMFPSEDVHQAAIDASAQWENLAGLDYVDVGAQFKVTVLESEAGDLDVKAEAVDPN